MERQIFEGNFFRSKCNKVSFFSSENSNDDEASETRGLGVYAQNIDLHLHAEDGTETPGALNLDGHSNNAFFQPEPALLDIADGTNSSNLPQEIVAPDNNFYRAIEQVFFSLLQSPTHLLFQTLDTYERSHL